MSIKPLFKRNDNFKSNSGSLLNLFEIDQNYISLQGSVYSSANLLPEFMKFLPLKSRYYHVIGTDRGLSLLNGYYIGCALNSVLMGTRRFVTEDENFYYVIAPGNGGYIYKLNKSDFSIVSQGTLSLRNSNGIINIIDEDANYLYLVNYNYYFVEYGIKVDKGTLQVTKTSPLYSTYSFFNIHLKTDTSHFMSISYRKKVSFYKYNKTNGTISLLRNYLTNRNAYYIPSQMINNESYLIQIGIQGELKGAHIKYDVNTEKVTIDPLTITDSAGIVSLTKDDTKTVVKTFIQGDVQKRVCAVVMEYYSGYGVQDLSALNIYVSDPIDPNNPAAINISKSVNLTEGGFRPRNILPLDTSFSKLLIIYDEKIDYYAFDNVQGTYVKIHTWSISPQSIGIDLLNRVWIVDKNNYIYSINPYKPVRVEARLENENIVFTGTPIQTNIILSAFDMDGNRVEATVTLTALTNNISFDTGDSKIVTTSTLQDTIVPITINDSGYINIKVDV